MWFTYWVDSIVVLAQFTICTICVALASDLTPQGEEENSQAHQTQEHSPGRAREVLSTILTLRVFKQRLGILHLTS